MFENPVRDRLNRLIFRKLADEWAELDGSVLLLISHPNISQIEIPGSGKSLLGALPHFHHMCMGIPARRLPELRHGANPMRRTKVDPPGVDDVSLVPLIVSGLLLANQNDRGGVGGLFPMERLGLFRSYRVIS